MQLLFALVCLVLLVLFAVIGLLKKSGKMLGTLAVYAGSLFGAAILARLLSGAVTKLAMNFALPKILAAMGAEKLAGTLNVLSESASVIIRTAIAPLVFVVLFLLILLIVSIVKKFVRVKKAIPDAPGVMARFCGLAVGMICGVLFILAFLAPLFGTLHTLDAVLNVGKTEQTEVVEEAEEKGKGARFSAVVALTDAPVARHIYGVGGETLYTYLTTAKWNGDRVVLRDEAVAITTALDQISALSAKPVSEYGEEEVAALRSVASSVDDSVLMSHILSGVISQAADAWSRGEEHLGISFPGMEGHYGRILKAFFSVFATTDADTVGADLGSFADVFDVLVRNEMFALLDDEASGEDNFADKLTGGDMVGELYTVLDQNARMHPVKVAIADVGMNVMLGQLGGSAGDLREEHGALMNDMAGALKTSVAGQSGTIDKDLLRADVATAITNNAVDVTDSVADLVVDALVDEFTAEELAALSEDEIVDRMVIRFEGVEN